MKASLNHAFKICGHLRNLRIKMIFSGIYYPGHNEAPQGDK